MIPLRLILALFTSLALTATATAQSDLDQGKYDLMLDACYYGAEDATARAACDGVVIRACIQGEEGGETTLGMASCAAAATKAWDGLLNAEYRETIGWTQMMDSEDKALFPEFANREDALRQAQRAWIAFRDAECGFAYAQWGAGSMRHIAGTECIRQLTAKRTLELGAARDVMR